jgi:hypothetical protein
MLLGLVLVGLLYVIANGESYSLVCNTGRLEVNGIYAGDGTYKGKPIYKSAGGSSIFNS